VTETGKTYFQSPIGWIKIEGGAEGIQALTFLDEAPQAAPSLDPLLADCFSQLAEYFQGARKLFSLKLHLSGTEFQQQVWQAVMSIPFGETAAYADIARKIGNPRAVRAVGQANGHNRLPIIIPCHRIIGSNHQLTGYSGGLWRKEWLLAHERK